MYRMKSLDPIFCYFFVGGLIQLVVREILQKQRVAPWIGNIQRTVQQVLTTFMRNHLPPLVVANRMALERIGSSQN